MITRDFPVSEREGAHWSGKLSPAGLSNSKLGLGHRFLEAAGDAQATATAARPSMIVFSVKAASETEFVLIILGSRSLVEIITRLAELVTTFVIVFTNITPTYVLIYADPDASDSQTRFDRAFQFP